MKNGTMFGRLARLLEPAILRTNPLFRFDTLYQDALYVPYAVTVFSVNPGDPFYFQAIQPNFDSEEQMAAYVTWLRRNSALQFPTQVDAGDRLLTLVTCHGPNDSERLAVALRQLRPGEEQAQVELLLREGIYKP